MAKSVYTLIKHLYLVWHTRHHLLCDAITHLFTEFVSYALDSIILTAVKRLSKALSWGF
ncbi:hypothetical protein [Piscirickettsia litoralis]|uniref:hypothetical protein n=1 Tax=Piscirickettsia litoralis TaxID=1891921 RepID=UPI0013019895|nr:hypothetical protein [Piscirickettsia litoralis]